MGQFENERQLWLDRLLQQGLEESLRPRNAVEKELAERREAQIRHWQFTRLAKRFMERWNELAREYNTRGAVDPKKFKAASKAFRDLERSDGWLAPR
jgi:hypothetical protein